MTHQKQAALTQLRKVAREITKAWPDFKKAVEKLQEAGFTESEREQLGETDQTLKKLLVTFEDMLANLV